MFGFDRSVYDLDLLMAGIGAAPSLPEGPSQNVTVETNIAAVCQSGQDTVQDLVFKVQEVFHHLKVMQLPYGTSQSSRASQSIATKVNDDLKQIELCFQKLRHLYRECQRRLPDDVNPCVLVPYVSTKLNSLESVTDELPIQKSAKELALEQKKMELEAVLAAKNKKIKSLLDQMRHLVWETNSIISLQHSI